MPQTFTQLHYHIVFSTKDREPRITPDIRDRVWDYLGGIVRGEGGMPILVGGMPDHIHLLASLPQTRAVADIVRQLKAVSSGWAHETFPDAALWWQTGYGAFTVSHSAVDAVKAYIERQEDHHQRTTFQNEFRLFLRKHGLEPDEEHMWG
jgi:REP element-mobilizing transposase RayT